MVELTLRRIVTVSLESGPEFFKLNGWLNSMLGRPSSRTRAIFFEPKSQPVFWSKTCIYIFNKFNRFTETLYFYASLSIMYLENQVIRFRTAYQKVERLLPNGIGCAHSNRSLFATHTDIGQNVRIRFWSCSCILSYPKLNYLKSQWSMLCRVCTGKYLAESMKTISIAVLRPRLCVSARC